MNPAWSVVLFTTLAGAAQGLVVTLALAELAGAADEHRLPRRRAGRWPWRCWWSAWWPRSSTSAGPQRAWRAVTMWRTSWLSREVIVLPAFIGVCALWWLALRRALATWPWLPLAGAGCWPLLLWLCTAMIYACIRFIQEWAQPLTLVNFMLIGLSSGLVLAARWRRWPAQRALLLAAAPMRAGC